MLVSGSVQGSILSYPKARLAQLRAKGLSETVCASIAFRKLAARHPGQG